MLQNIILYTLNYIQFGRKSTLKFAYVHFLLYICARNWNTSDKLMQHPNLYIIAGPNGAGKTTASYNLLPEVLHCPNFVNADEIARGLSPFAPETVAFQAGRIMLQRIEELLSQRVDFAIETTLATRSYVQLVRRAQALGYKVHLIFFFLENEEQAIQRVAQRVSNGGHNIPEPDIRRRFKRGIYNLLNLYMPICEVVYVLNNNYVPAKLVAQKTQELGSVSVYDEAMWQELIDKGEYYERERI